MNSRGFWVAMMMKSSSASIVPILGTVIFLSSIAGSRTFWTPSGMRLSSFMNSMPPWVMAVVSGPSMKASFVYPFLRTRGGSNQPTSFCSV